MESELRYPPPPANQGNPFDVSIDFRQGDLLALHFGANALSAPESYGFCYARGKWKKKPYDPFGWRAQHRSEAKGGIRMKEEE